MKRYSLKRLQEQLNQPYNLDVDFRFLADEIIDEMLQTYEQTEYAELGVFMSMLRSLNLLLQSYHWTTTGESSYSDHLLYQRLYEGINEQVDLVGEKAVGMGGIGLVGFSRTLDNMMSFLMNFQGVQNEASEGASSRGNTLAKRAYFVEKLFVNVGEKLMEQLEAKGELSRGVENMMGGILDTHENYCYLLKQRVSEV